MKRMFREPTLSDLLDDPVTAIIMAHDGVTRDEIIGLLASVAARRRAVNLRKPPQARPPISRSYRAEPLGSCLARGL